MRSSKEAWKIEFLLGYRDIGVSPCTTRVFDIHKILRRNESFKQLFRFQGSPRHGHETSHETRIHSPAGFSYLAYKSPRVFSLLPSTSPLSFPLPTPAHSIRTDCEEFEIFQSGVILLDIGIVYVRKKK